MPVVAKIPAVVGIKISVAKVKALTVNTPNDGGVSIIIKSNLSSTGVITSFRRCSLPVCDNPALLQKA